VTLAECAADARRALVAAGRDERESRQDVSVLARRLLGWPTARWLAHLNDDAPAEFARHLAQLVGRRARGEPVAYLTGEREFYGRPFHVSPDVLIPRPETEFVVEEALACLRDAAGAPTVVDVGTGSGCIAVTIALQRPDAHVIGTDISRRALAVAARNAAELGALDRVKLRAGSLLAGLNGPVDLVVSNPPYVAATDRAALPVDVVNYEPGTALFGGDDGLDVIRALIPAAASVLAPGGCLVMEIGIGQARDIEHLIDATGTMRVIRVRNDLQDIPRVVVARS
jgi:release factor glutamine methyltransferase